MNLYIPHNRRTPLQAEEVLGPISIPRGSRGVDPFSRTSASMAEKPGAYSTPATPSGRGGGVVLDHIFLLWNENDAFSITRKW